MFPAFFMSFMSDHLFHTALANEIPVRKSRRHSRNQIHLQQQSLPSKLRQVDSQQSITLEKSDVTDLIEAAERTSPLKVNLLRAVCYIKFCCKRDREMKLRRIASSHFEKMLDVRNFIRTQMNVTLLISMLLTRE